MSFERRATATATDAQTWVYPPPGAPTPPVAATSNFGPVHLNDRMVLQWAPSTTPDEVIYTCFSESLQETDWIVGKKLSQPFTYQFMNEATQSNSSDLLFCHFYFSPSVMGNTVVFQFKNEPAAKIATWEGPMAPSSVSKTVTSALSTSTVSVKSTPAGTSTSSASSNPSSGGGLSTGASAGIGVGAAVAVLAILAAVFFFWRSRKLKRQQNDAWIRPPPSAEISYKSAAQTHAYSSPTTITTFGGEMEGSPTPVELKGSSSEYELRGNAPGHELDNSDSKRGW